MRVTHDPSVDAAYIYLAGIPAGAAAHQVPVEWDRAAGQIILDLDVDGRLISVEVLAARNGLPKELLDQGD